MKRLYEYILSVGAVLMVISCSQQQEIIETEYTAAATLSIDLGVESRADLLNALPEGATYFVVCNNQTSLVDYSNGQSTIQSPISLTPTYVRAFAFYPYVESNLEKFLSQGEWHVNATDGIDFLYGKSTRVSCYNPKAKITMHHALTYVKFNVACSSSLASEIKDGLQLLSANLTNIALSGYINEELEVVNDAQLTTIEYAIDNGDVVNGEIEFGDFLMPYSKTDKTDKQLQLHLNKGIGTLTVTIPYSSWKPEAGVVNTYYITIEDEYKATVQPNATIEEWNANAVVQVNDQGHVPGNAVDLGCSKLWADRNLGALSNSDYGQYFAIDEIEAAIYDQWGDGWSVPTAADYEELMSKCTCTWSEKSGVKGLSVKGNDNSIFFPAGGWKSASVLHNINWNGAYVTASECLWTFSSDNAYALTGYLNDTLYTIRPVKAK